MELWLFRTAPGRREFVDDVEALNRTYRGVGSALKAACIAIARGDRVGKRMPGTDDLWEVVLSYQTMEFRVIYARDNFAGSEGLVMLALHAFRKNTRKTPLTAIETAEKRLRVFRSLNK